MGRDTGNEMIPRYREVLVETAFRAIRDSLPAVRAFAAERRAWLAAAADPGGWRAAAIAAGAVPDHAILR